MLARVHCLSSEIAQEVYFLKASTRISRAICGRGKRVPRQSRQSEVKNRQKRIMASANEDFSQSLGLGEPGQRAQEGKSENEQCICMPILHSGILRFDANFSSRNMCTPSVSFKNGAERDMASRDAEAWTPRDVLDVARISFSTRSPNQVVEIQLPPGTSMYGTGEVAGSLERTGRRVYCWNTDSWGYSATAPSLYQSHPWVFALLPDGRSLGFLADTTRRCEIDLRTEGRIQFSAAGVFPLITFGPSAEPADVLQLLSEAIGTIPMPPLWALGYHQCRFSYATAGRVREVAATFRSKAIPCDVIWMDIDYMDGFKCFTFHPVNFPDPQALNRDLHGMGFRAVWMLDPGIAVVAGAGNQGTETTGSNPQQGELEAAAAPSSFTGAVAAGAGPQRYEPYESGCREDVWVQQEGGEAFVGDVWPGPCKFPDFTMRRTREWWAQLVQEFASNGVDGIWNDMNEPAVFRTVNKSMPDSNVHRGDADLGGTQQHVHYHNAYGMLMARATFEGLQRAHPSRRPFVLTRAGFIGSQRYAATWTGDNLATWEHLHFSIPMALNLALSGQPLSGPDIGGFAGDASPLLFARWMGVGALLPFARAHSEKGTRDAEPWAFGPECEDVCRRAISRRYRFLPHLYSLFAACHREGRPVMAPAFFGEPSSPELRRQEEAFLLGGLLVVADTSPPGAPTAKRHLPSGTWRRLHFQDSHRDLPQLFLQGGCIVPTGPPVQSTAELDGSQPLTLLISLDAAGAASGELYEDEGEGLAFEQGDFCRTTYTAEVLHSSLQQGEVLRSSSGQGEVLRSSSKQGEALPWWIAAAGRAAAQHELRLENVTEADGSVAGEGGEEEEEAKEGGEEKDEEEKVEVEEDEEEGGFVLVGGVAQSASASAGQQRQRGGGGEDRGAQALLQGTQGSEAQALRHAPASSTMHEAEGPKGQPQLGGRGPAGGLQLLLRAASVEGVRERPQRQLVARVLLGDGAYVEAHGVDGEDLLLPLPSEAEARRLVAAALQAERKLIDSAPLVPGPSADDDDSGGEDLAGGRPAVLVAGGDFSLRVVLKHGGRLDSLLHTPSGQELLEARWESGGYEEYSLNEYRAAGCQERYRAVWEGKDSLGHLNAIEVEADIGSGLVMRRRFTILSPGGNSEAAPGSQQGLPASGLRVQSRIEAEHMGAGAGGFSRLACLRVHPSFRVVQAFSSDPPFVEFTDVAGNRVQLTPAVREVWLQGDRRPNGEWRLVDNAAGHTIVNTFNPEEVATCFLYWGSGFCNLEMMTEERSVSADTPLKVSHTYHVILHAA